MNKELVKTYFKEFEHWLNDGKLLHKDEFGNWENTRDIWDLRTERIKAVVINDEYVEFRKALAEGKTIQYCEHSFKGWKDVDSIEQSCKHPNSFRIKPESPKFKVGDWVIHNGEYKRVTKAVDGYIDSLDNQVAVIMKEESLELWEPQDKEYFWYKNDLVKFHETQTNYGTLLMSIRGCSYYPAEVNFEEFCEPFIGQIPTNIKN